MVDQVKLLIIIIIIMRLFEVILDNYTFVMIDVRLARLCWFRFFQITNLMHNSFILQQYVCYITILNMFRAVPCSSSGGQIVLPQPLVSSLSVNGRTVCILYGCLLSVTIPEAVVIQFVPLRMSRVLLETCWGS